MRGAPSGGEGLVERRAALGAALARGWRQRGPRAALGACLLALWFVGYFGVAHSALVARARHAAPPWDCPIPFSGWAVWIYLAGLPMIATPLLLLRPGRPLRRAVLSYLVVIVAATACFALFPVASGQLRTAADGLGLDPLTALALATLRALDPPFNSFPSLHVALGALAAWSVADAAPAARVGSNLALALLAWSVCAVKQHYVVDVAGGLALALAARAWVGAGVARPGPGRPSRLWGPPRAGDRRACQSLPHGAARSDTRQRRLGAANRNRCRALLLLARLNPPRKLPRATRPSWRTLPRAALPLALVCALFLMFYARAG